MTSTVTDATRLAERLKLHPPSRVEEAPATLAFERSRHITLPWLELAGEIADLQKAELGSKPRASAPDQSVPRPPKPDRVVLAI